MFSLPFSPKRCTVFCDETAQAGPNWQDEHPFYITAAWIVREERIPLFQSSITELRTRLNLQHRKPEVKGRDLRNNKRRQEFAFSWLHSIAADDEPLAYPAYYILERRFGACGKIVDLLLDPGNNANADWLEIEDYDLREEITELIYAECPPNVLKHFCEALFKPSEASWAVALGELASVEWSNKQLKETIRATTTIADKLFDVEFGRISREGKDPALPHSPNYFSFRHLLQTCDVAIRNIRPGCRATAIHDEQKQYAPYFEKLFAWASAVGARESNGGPQLPRLLGGFRAMDEFKMPTSAQEVGVQAADLLAWIVYQLVGATCGDPTVSGIAKETEFFKLIISPWLMREDNLMGRMHASRSIKHKMWDRENAL